MKTFREIVDESLFQHQSTTEALQALADEMDRRYPVPPTHVELSDDGMITWEQNVSVPPRPNWPPVSTE